MYYSTIQLYVNNYNYLGKVLNKGSKSTRMVFPLHSPPMICFILSKSAKVKQMKTYKSG